MKVAGVAELKARLSSYLAAVKQGEEVTVTDRGKPIARLVPLDAAAAGRGRLQELARAGLVRLPLRQVSAEEILGRPRPRDPEGRVLRLVLEEREEGR
jgi:prevent-host-death family protein